MTRRRPIIWTLGCLLLLAQFSQPLSAATRGVPLSSARSRNRSAEVRFGTEASSIPAVPDATRDAVQQTIEHVYPALVQIHVVTTNPAGGRLNKFESGGSGAVIGEAGIVITNHHVAGNASRIVCRMYDGEEIEADLVGTDALTDISILRLRLEERADGAPPLAVAAFGDSDAVRVGDTVLAMGSPAALSQSVTKGIVSNTAMIQPEHFFPFTFRLEGEPIGTLVRWIGHDAAIQPGSSGGPLVNLCGEIIGINEIHLGLGGAIPSNLARSVAEQLVAGGRVRRTWTGIEPQPRLKDSNEEKGVLVGGVIEGSPAGLAGLRPGDVLTEFDGVAVDCRIREDLAPFNRLVLSTPIGREIEVKAVRNGRIQTFRFLTEAREKARGDVRELREWGITARDFTRMSALERRRGDAEGVLVDTIRAGGPCNMARPPLRPGDVIVRAGNRDIRSIGDLRSTTKPLVEASADRVPILVSFERKTLHLMTVVWIGEGEEEEEPRLSRKAWLPVATQVLTTDLADALGLAGRSGVRVTQVYPGRTAEEAGIEVGDVILAVDGDRIDATHPEHKEIFPAMIRQYRIGAEVLLDLYRKGTLIQVRAVLDAPPIPATELKRYRDEDFELSVRELTLDERITRRMGEDEAGVLVEEVLHAGWAALGQLASGDILLAIDDLPTPGPDAVEKILKAAVEERRQRLSFFVRRGIHTRYLELELAWGEEEVP